jgi:beta-glucosidase/6-phospho-beta-glucosidase/beta-galactosidase
MSSHPFVLPEGFLFGVCNSPYHSEGGYNTLTGPHNNWSIWEQNGWIERSGDTNRFWTDWQPHIDAAQSAGLNVFRMGIEWARLQPASAPDEAPAPAWDPTAVDRYAEILAAVYRAGMEPCITLHHFTHPGWLGPLMWTDAAKVARFLDFVRYAVGEVNARLATAGFPAIRHYVVFNEPYNALAGPYLFGDAPPGTIKDDRAGFGQATVAMLRAYVEAYDLIYDLHEAHGWRAPHVGFNIVSYSLYELDKWYLDVVRAPALGVPRAQVPDHLAAQRAAFEAALHPLARARLTPTKLAYWQAIAEHNRALYAGFDLEPLLDALYRSPRARKLDYIAIDCYDPFVFATLGAAAAAAPEPARPIGADRFDWTKLSFDPDVTREHLRLHGRDLTDIPLYVLETTIGHNHKRGGPPEPRPDGLTVAVFLRRMLSECVRLIRDGIPLHGFLYWTLCDNYEWGTFTSRLGLVEYDYKQHLIKDTDAFGAPNLRQFADLIGVLRAGDQALIEATFAPSRAPLSVGGSE